MNNLFENWNDTASWTTDGSLQYDERNHVLYFDLSLIHILQRLRNAIDSDPETFSGLVRAFDKKKIFTLEGDFYKRKKGESDSSE